MIFELAARVLGVLAVVAGLAAILISVPDSAWQRAMVRLSTRLQAQGLAPLPPSSAETTPELVEESLVPAQRSGGALTSSSAEPSLPEPPPAESLLDRVIDGVIEVLRRMIGSRGFPRTTLRVVGVILLVFAMACFTMASLMTQSERDNEEGARAVSAPSSQVARPARSTG